MRIHLFTGSGHAPWEYVELILCRDVYHCRPSELGEEDWATVSTHLELLKTEAEVMNAKKKAMESKAKARRGRRHRR